MSASGQLAGWILRRWGWTIAGEKPAESRYVLLAARHPEKTSRVRLLEEDEGVAT